MTIPYRRLFAAALAAVLFAASNTSSGAFVAIGPWPADATTPPMQLYSINAQAGSATLIAPTTISRVQGLAPGAPGEVIGTIGSTLYSFDLTTGQAEQIASLPFTSTEGGIARRPNTNEYYIVSGASTPNPPGLYKYNLDTHTGGFVGDFGFSVPQDVSGAEFHAAGTLYILHSNQVLNAQMSISAIDLVTGMATTLFNTGVPNTGTAGLAFDPQGNGFLTNGSALYGLNVNSKTANLIGPHGIPRLAGLVFAVIPEPTGAALCLAAMVALAHIRGRRDIVL